MEETLGKRISANRKRLSLTQDGLAERLGVTAQAVSKWENDQSCPDISMLPKLAELFGISIDALLGCEKPKQEEKVYESEVVVSGDTEDDTAENEGIHCRKGCWEFRWDGGKRSSIGFAVWVLLVGGLLCASSLLHWELSFWEALWPSALLVGGLFGLLSRFSFFSLGCALFGGYFLVENIGVVGFRISSNLVFPICLLLFGMSLLVDAMRKPRRNKFTVSHRGKPIPSHHNSCNQEDESFDCSTSFGENTYFIDLPRLSRGQATLSFGELTVDLTGCEEIAPNCHVEANCSFGELNILIPRCYRVEPDVSTAFAALDIKGQPDPDARGVINLDASVSFGEITIRYI